MSFGDGNHGALGISSSIPGMGNDAYEPTLVSNLPSDVSFVSAGHYHSLAVTSSGEIWAWSRNEEGQLGRIGSRETRSEPKRVGGLDNVSVRVAFASSVVSTAIGGDGSLWVWGRSKRGQLGLGKGVIEALVPSRVDSLAQERIVKVQRWGHALALTVDGRVSGWGYVADGRVGNVGVRLEASPLDSVTHGDDAGRKVAEAMEKEKDMPIAWEPCLVEELRGVKLGCSCKQDLGMSPVEIIGSPISLTAGLGHSLAICDIESEVSNTRVVTSWGWNRSQQFGRGKPEDLPRKVEGLDGESPASVSARRVHSLCVTERGEAWVWGCGRNGRLGLGSSIDEP